MKNLLINFKIFLFDNLLTSLLLIGFLICSLLPQLGIFFSIFVLGIILSITLFNIYSYVPALLIILLISNSFDPYISIFSYDTFFHWEVIKAPNVTLQLTNPLHMGLLQLINPNWILGFAATARVTFDIFYRYYSLSKISFINVCYLLLIAISIVTSIMGWQLDNPRRLQTLFFLFNISICLWFYRLVLHLSDLEIKKLIYWIKALLISTVLIYITSFTNYGFSVSTHIKFFIIALLPISLFVVLNYSIGWYKYLLIIPIGAVITQYFLYHSLTTGIILFSTAIFYFVSSSQFKNRFIFFKILFFVFLATQISIFSTPFMDFNIIRYEIYTDINDVVGYLNRIWFKFSLDRLPLWLGALDGIKESIWIKPAGSTYVPYNFGTFALVDRQIQWSAGAHQMQLELMVNYGLVGAVIYWGIWVAFMRRIFLAVNSTMAITRFLSVGLLAYFILPSYVANFMIQEHSTLPWLLLGLTMALYQKFK